ncbi:hypothetical protein EDB83DRAFT_2319911 [Lactarius deliciosus]|nr:hypothetical protein EDB83DRAFT_2319911 [Lactarius deliciosus]
MEGRPMSTAMWAAEVLRLCHYPGTGCRILPMHSTRVTLRLFQCSRTKSSSRLKLTQMRNRKIVDNCLSQFSPPVTILNWEMSAVCNQLTVRALSLGLGLRKEVRTTSRVWRCSKADTINNDESERLRPRCRRAAQWRATVTHPVFAEVSQARDRGSSPPTLRVVVHKGKEGVEGEPKPAAGQISLHCVQCTGKVLGEVDVQRPSTAKILRVRDWHMCIFPLLVRPCANTPQTLTTCGHDTGMPRSHGSMDELSGDWPQESKANRRQGMRCERR